LNSSKQQCARLTWLPVLLLLATLPGAAAEPAPFRLTLDLSAIGTELSSAMRIDLEREIFVRLKEYACFEEVRIEPPETIEAGDLRLEVHVTNYQERANFESSVHQNARSDQVDPVHATAEISADVKLRLISDSDQLELRHKSGQRHISWRPPTGQDAMYGGRLRWLDNVGQLARRMACQGGARKLTREIEKRRRESR
jgi:hypothetical protein